MYNALSNIKNTVLNRAEAALVGTDVVGTSSVQHILTKFW